MARGAFHVSAIVPLFSLARHCPLTKAPALREDWQGRKERNET